jgi:ACS family glucarate transporter-like MFS transporter
MNPEKSTYVRWYLIFWLFLLSAIAFLDRVNISIASVFIAKSYSLSDTQLGWIFSAFLVGYALFQTPGGWLADRLGSRRVLTVGVLWWGVFTALAAAIPSKTNHALLAFIVIRFLLGAGEAIIYPATNQFVSRWIPTQERGMANGLIFAGVGTGAMIAPPLITFAMVRWGWRWPFCACAIIGIIAGAVWFVISRDSPEENSWVSAAELAKIKAGLTFGPRRSSEDAAVAGPLPWKTIISSKEVWGLTFSYFCYGYVAWIFFSWFYKYLATVRGLDLKSSAFYSILPFLAMALASPLGGFVSDLLSKSRGKRVGRCGLAVFSMALAGAFIAYGSHVVDVRLAVIVLAGGAGALYLSQSSFWSVSADIGGASSGAVSGLMNMGAQFGGAITASLTPAIAMRYGWTASFLAAVILCACGALSWLVVDPQRQLPSAGSAISSSRGQEGD